MSAARRMAATGAIPRVDWLSFTLAGRPWIDFEWLCQLLWYGALKLFGPWGLLAVKAAFLASAAGCLWGLLALYALPAESRGLGLLAWIVALSPGNDLRPENLSLFFLSLEFLALEAGRLGVLDGAWKGAGARRAFGVSAVLLFIVWANCHPGFLYGLALLGIYAAADWGRTRRPGLALLALGCLAATCVNPFGPGLYRVFAEHLKDMAGIARYILEWREPSVLDPWLAAFWAVLAAAFLSMLARFLQDREVPAEHLAAVFSSALASASHVRAAVYFIAVGVPVAALHLSRLDWRRLGGAPVRRALFAVSSGLLLWFFAVRLAPELRDLQPFAARFIPRDASPFLRRERAVLGPLRLLNPWHWGGYLGWEFYPDYKVFYDGRYIFHPLLREREEAVLSPEAYKAFLSRHGIELVLLERTGQFFKMPAELSGGRAVEMLRPFYLAFLPKADWALVYWSPRSLVFARRSAAPAGWIREHEFKLLRPDDLRAAELEVREGLAPWNELAAESERFLELNPGFPEAGELRAWVAGFKPASRPARRPK